MNIVFLLSLTKAKISIYSHSTTLFTFFLVIFVEFYIMIEKV